MPQATAPSLYGKVTAAVGFTRLWCLSPAALLAANRKVQITLVTA